MATIKNNDLERLIKGAFRAGQIHQAGGIGAAMKIDRKAADEFAKEQVRRWNAEPVSQDALLAVAAALDGEIAHQYEKGQGWEEAKDVLVNLDYLALATAAVSA